ncbi:MAG: YihY family inner membrane protein [Ramlibacter sp.]
MKLDTLLAGVSRRLEQRLANLSRFPWLSAGRTLVERFREDRLGLTASSLTFTTTIALVPLVTVTLAVFSAFPMFNKVQGAVQTWLVQSLVPDAIARQVLGYLTQFSGKASSLGVVGLGALFVSALALVLTIDRTLNGIWRVRRARPLAQRVLIYWAVMTLGPLLLGASLTVTSYALYASRGLVSSVPGALQFLLDLLEFSLLALGLSALYRFVPNTPVERHHAAAGGLFAAFGIEVAKRLLAWYLSLVPTYSVVYGAFATVPILLVWIYLAWLVVLLGAVIAAHLPALLGAGRRTASAHGWQFQLALELLLQLERVRSSTRRGLSIDELVTAIEVDPLQLEPVLDTLVRLDWVGRLNEADDDRATRYVLLADVQSTTLEPLLRNLLLSRTPATQRLWGASRWGTMVLRDVL